MTGIFFLCVGILMALAAFVVVRRYLGFLAQTPADYASADTPLMDIRQHLNGPILCEGVIYGPTGRVTSRFTGDFQASWDGNVGTMTERFSYSDGTTQDRVWHLQLAADGKIVARAPDVVGQGHGQQSGPTALLRYRIKLPQDAGGHVLDTTDWMYLAPNGTIINRSQFRKFGIKVAELVATMRPRELT